MPRHQRNEFAQQAFAERLEKALEMNPNAPPKFHGERVWLTEQMMKRGKPVSQETVRKWVNGLAMPAHDKVPLLADALGVDADWLLYGNTVSDRRKKNVQHSVDAAAATNLVAGIIQMNGGDVVFPAEGRGSQAVHLQAIIKRASYPLHITVAQRKGDGLVEVSVPARTDEAVIVAVLPAEDGFSYNLYEVPEDVLREGSLRSGMRVVETDLESLRPITSFAERL